MSMPTKTGQEQILAPLFTHANALLIGALGIVLCMIIMPISPGLLDFFLAVNMVAAITILINAIQGGAPSGLTTFPATLLVATLFRLGLNIASTRLILTKGEAGKIIHTFGNFATDGNVMAGLILFFVVAIIQFIVIAKGAERVAEVSARFSLDALPGRQMSIDADLRAGQISMEEAKQERQSLHEESKLYGAMDGAMKFVKGDAIAGLVIIFINILGGLMTGIVQQGYSPTQAAIHYTTLTIGDGLVNQIPALLLSMTAGFVVTRVSNQKNNHSLGSTMCQQMVQTKTLLSSACLIFLLGFIPGFPLVFFWLLALLFVAAAFFLAHFSKRQKQNVAPLDHLLVEQVGGDFCGAALPFVLEVGPQLYKTFKNDARWSTCFGVLYPRVCLFLSEQMGMIFPPIKIRINNTFTHSTYYQIQIHEVPVDRGLMLPKHCALPVGLDSQCMAIKPQQTTHTWHGTPIQLWDLAQKTALQKNGMRFFEPEEMLLRHLVRVLKKHAADFMGIQETKNLLDAMESQYPELVQEVVPKAMSLQKLTDILKRLVDEGIPIKDKRGILEALATLNPDSKDAVSLTEQVRISLTRTMTHLYASANAEIQAITLSTAIEDEIRGSIQKQGSECYLALPPERISALRSQIAAAFQNPSHPAIFLTQTDIRRYVRQLITSEIPGATVLSYQELEPHITIVTKAHVT